MLQADPKTADSQDLILDQADNPKALTRQFIDGAAKKLLIGGNWVAAKSGKTFEVIDPSTEDVIATVAEGGADDVAAAVDAARQAFLDPSWSAITPEQRAAYLLKIADTILAHTDELGALQALEMGVVFKEGRTVGALMADMFRYWAGFTTKIMGRTNPSGPGVFNYSLREPLGVVGAIIPWNAPVQETCWKIGPALACGNTMVMKPAEDAPLVALRIAELIHDTGLPPGVFNLVTGYGDDAGEALATHPHIAKIGFTGSTPVGQHLMEAGAKTMKKVTLELGGKSPTVIFADADMAKTIPMALYNFIGQTGQICVAGTRIIVQDSVYDEVLAQLKTAAEAVVHGSPFDEATTIGPLISEEQRKRVLDYIQIGQDEGATLVTGGAANDDKGFFVRPTIFADVKPDMRIWREEIFGPVACVTKFTDEADAIAQANDSDFGLAGSVWSQDVGQAIRVSRALQTGTIWVNAQIQLSANSPFGGYKLSGSGREMSEEAVEAYTQIKSIYIGL